MNINKPIITAVFAMSLATPLHAQPDIEELVVTATKRASTLQEVPVAVSVVSSDVIEKSAVVDIKDLQALVPSLKITQLQNAGNTNFIIRGFGNGANNVGIEPSVGVFIDGVYRSRSAAAISDLPRLERVEVLRGPQSTLFGKNASAGVISVVTPKPNQDEFIGLVSGTLGNYQQTMIKGLVSGPLSDTTAFEISAGVNERDGYTDNVFTGGDVNTKDRESFRGQLLFAPSAATEIRIIADYDKSDEICCTANYTQLAFPGNPLLEILGGRPLINDPFGYQVATTTDPVSKVENSGVSLHIDHQYDGFDLTSITSFRTVENSTNVDSDFTTADIFTVTEKADIETFTQEIRLTSNGDGAVDWMIGGFYFDETLEWDSNLDFGIHARPFFDTLAGGGLIGFESILASLGLVPPGSFYAAGSGTTERVIQDDKATSLFGQFDWHISDQLTATVGLNYTKDEKDVDFRQTRRDIWSSIPLEVFGASALAPLQFLEPIVDFPNSVEPGKSDDDDLTYTLRLAYDVSDNLNVYASYATGFKATSWSITRNSLPFASSLAALQAAGLTQPNQLTGTRFARPEESTVFELGLKARFEKGSLNLAVFQQEIKDFQSTVFTGTGFNLANAGKQSTDGVELDFTYYPIDSLKFTFAGTYLDPIYDTFVGASGIGGTIVDLSGQRPNGIHEISLTTALTYSFNVRGWDAFLRGEYIYEDEVPLVENVPQTAGSREVGTVNLSAGIANENGLSFSIWGRNVTDDEYHFSAFPNPIQTGNFNAYPNAPATYGITVTKEF